MTWWIVFPIHHCSPLTSTVLWTCIVIRDQLQCHHCCLLHRQLPPEHLQHHHHIISIFPCLFYHHILVKPYFYNNCIIKDWWTVAAQDPVRIMIKDSTWTIKEELPGQRRDSFANTVTESSQNLIMLWSMRGLILMSDHFLVMFVAKDSEDKIIWGITNISIAKINLTNVPAATRDSVKVVL